MKKKGGIITVLSLIGIMLVCTAAVVLLITKGFQSGEMKIKKAQEAVSYPVVVDEAVDVSFNKITITSDASNITVTNSSDGKSHILIRADKDKLNYYISNGEITIIDWSKGKKVLDTTKSSSIELSIPQDYTGKFSVDSDYGDVRFDKFPSATLKAKCNAGNIVVDEIDGISADCDAGNISLGTVNNYVKIENDYGNVTAEYLNLKKSSEIECDAGNIEINKTNDIHIIGKSDLGDCNIARDNPTSNIILKLSADVGNINAK